MKVNKLLRIFSSIIITTSLTLLFGFNSLLVIPIFFLTVYVLSVILFGSLQFTRYRVGDLPNGLHVDADWPHYLLLGCYLVSLVLMLYLFSIKVVVGGALIYLSLDRIFKIDPPTML